MELIIKSLATDPQEVCTPMGRTRCTTASTPTASSKTRRAASSSRVITPSMPATKVPEPDKVRNCIKGNGIEQEKESSIIIEGNKLENDGDLVHEHDQVRNCIECKGIEYGKARKSKRKKRSGGRRSQY